MNRSYWKIRDLNYKRDNLKEKLKTKTKCIENLYILIYRRMIQFQTVHWQLHIEIAVNIYLTRINIGFIL